MKPGDWCVVKKWWTDVLSDSSYVGQYAGVMVTLNHTRYALIRKSSGNTVYAAVHCVRVLRPAEVTFAMRAERMVRP